MGTLGVYGAGPEYGCTLVKVKILYINVYVQLVSQVKFSGQQLESREVCESSVPTIIIVNDSR